jgi:hypothetical protein
MACLLYWVDTSAFNVWLGVARRHAIHDTPEAGRLTTGRSHSVYAAFDGERVSPNRGRFTQVHGMAEKR